MIRTIKSVSTDYREYAGIGLEVPKATYKDTYLITKCSNSFYIYLVRGKADYSYENLTALYPNSIEYSVSLIHSRLLKIYSFTYYLELLHKSQLLLRDLITAYDDI